MKIHFYHQKQQTKIIQETVTLEEFGALLNKYKPTEIFNRGYSEKIPCWYITEYLPDSSVMIYAHSAADKTPKEKTMGRLYTDWLTQGLGQCYFDIEGEDKPTPDNFINEFMGEICEKIVEEFGLSVYCMIRGEIIGKYETEEDRANKYKKSQTDETDSIRQS